MRTSHQTFIRAFLALASLIFGVVPASAQTNSLPDHTLKAHAILLEANTNSVTLLLLCQNVSSQSVAVVLSDLQFDDNRSLRKRLTSGRMVFYVKKPQRPDTPVLLRPGQYAGVEIRQPLESDSLTVADILQGKARMSFWLRAALPPSSSNERIALHCDIAALTSLPAVTSTNPPSPGIHK